MDINLEMDNEVIILKLTGNLVASTVEALKVQVAKLIEKKHLYILFDLGKVDFVDSSGLGVCMGIRRDLAANDGLLACVGLNENIRKLFQMTRADQKIMVFATRQEGVNTLLERSAATHKKYQV